MALVSSWYGEPGCRVSWDFLTLLTEDLPLQMYLRLRAVVLSPVGATEVPTAAHEHKHEVWTGCLNCCYIKSQNPKLVWIGRNLKVHLIPPPAMGRVTFH